MGREISDLFYAHWPRPQGTGDFEKLEEAAHERAELPGEPMINPRTGGEVMFLGGDTGLVVPIERHLGLLATGFSSLNGRQNGAREGAGRTMLFDVGG